MSTVRKFDDALAELWAREFVSNGLCALCGNRGFIDTTGLRSRVGVPCGTVLYCICPNGRIAKRSGITLRDLLAANPRGHLTL